MIKELKCYLDSEGISATKFNCKHYKVCKGDNDNFVEASEPYIGIEYEKNRLPRILFVSLDTGYADSDPHKRTMEYYREEMKESNPLEITTPHWRETHILAWKTLKRFKPNLKFSDVGTYFAHINSAKCCENNKSKSKASEMLFENCREFLPKEIEILSPDILVTQGTEARWVVEYGIYKNDKDCYDSVDRLEINVDGCEVCLIKVGVKEIIWLHTYHPAARPRNLYKFQEAAHFDRRIDIIYEHVSYYGWGDK